MPRGLGEVIPRQWPSNVLRGVWCQALSLIRPPVPWPELRDLYFPGAGDVGMGTQHQPHSVRSCEPALRVVGGPGGRSR